MRVQLFRIIEKYQSTLAKSGVKTSTIESNCGTLLDLACSNMKSANSDFKADKFYLVNALYAFGLSSFIKNQPNANAQYLGETIVEN